MLTTAFLISMAEAYRILKKKKDTVEARQGMVLGKANISCLARKAILLKNVFI